MIGMRFAAPLRRLNKVNTCVVRHKGSAGEFGGKIFVIRLLCKTIYCRYPQSGVAYVWNSRQSCHGALWTYVCCCAWQHWLRLAQHFHEEQEMSVP